MEESYQAQQEVPVSSDEMYASAIQEDKVRNIISQISPENQLAEVEMRIRGYKKDMFTSEWVKIDPNSEEINTLLVSRFISYLSSIMNQNTSLSSLSEKNINEIMKLVTFYITDDLDCNAIEYGLQDNYTERTRIGHIMLNSIFMVLNRALGGRENSRMWKSVSFSESANMNNQNQSKLKEALSFWK